MVLFVNPLTPRVKLWVIQSFLTFGSMDRTCVNIHWKVSPFIGKRLNSTLLLCCLFFDFPQFEIVENLSVFCLGADRSERGKLLCYPADQ